MRQHGFVLYMCAGLLLTGAAVLGGSSTWTLMRISYYFWTTDLGVELAGGVLYVAGALLCLPVCWLTTLVPYHTKSQSLLATLLCCATAALLVLAVALVAAGGLARALRDPHALNASMHRALALDALDPAVRSSFAAMQCDLRCCGVQSYMDWYNHRRTLPPSCCGRARSGKPRVAEVCATPLHAAGCLRPALIELRNYISALTTLSSAIIIILAVTVFAAAYTLVAGVVERQKPLQPLRVAYFTPPAAAFTPTYTSNPVPSS
ncbi:uncharacterized protein isoform X2 [Choristoneura fumiferana]|uniref:uncharacterized protein isoform X2 n=1 Tax=Choristoneura fumiferana TaxID=7141 RepID=UPI003D1570EC